MGTSYRSISLFSEVAKSRHEQSFRHVNIHTLINKLLQKKTLCIDVLIDICLIYKQIKSETDQISLHFNVAKCNIIRVAYRICKGLLHSQKLRTLSTRADKLNIRHLKYRTFWTSIFHKHVQYVNQSMTVALDMSKAFDTVIFHILINKLLQTNNH